MIFAADTDPEDELKKALKAFLVCQGVRAIIDGEQRPPGVHVVIMGAQEQRDAIPHRIDGKAAEWAQWQVMMDVVADEKSGAIRSVSNPSPKVCSTLAALRKAFRPALATERNAKGIYTVRIRDANDQRDGVMFNNPFSITCETFIYTS